jgi:pimeloyl-ACP methyl ester carboxylesterase
MKRVRVNGVSLGYVDEGRGAPVVFVHGSYSDHRLWEPQRAAVSRAYRFIALDQRYFGIGPWPDDGEHYSQQTQIDDLAAFIRGLDVGPVHLVGWSLSGGLVLRMVAQREDLVRSVFAYEPALGLELDPADAKLVQEDLRTMLAPAIAAARAGDHAAAVRNFMDGVDDRPGTFDAMPAAGRTMALENARTLPLQFVASPPPPLNRAQLGEIGAPVAIVRGARTRPCYRIVADAAARCMPGAKRIVVPEARHLWPVHSPAAFNDLLLGFLGTANASRD